MNLVINLIWKSRFIISKPSADASADDHRFLADGIGIGRWLKSAHRSSTNHEYVVHFPKKMTIIWCKFEVHCVMICRCLNKGGIVQKKLELNKLGRRTSFFLCRTLVWHHPFFFMFYLHKKDVQATSDDSAAELQRHTPSPPNLIRAQNSLPFRVTFCG